MVRDQGLWSGIVTAAIVAVVSPYSKASTNLTANRIKDIRFQAYISSFDNCRPSGGCTIRYWKLIVPEKRFHQWKNNAEERFPALATNNNSKSRQVYTVQLGSYFLGAILSIRTSSSYIAG